MAERYRKGSKQRIAVNCKITAEAKLYLHELAGNFALGYAIEQLVADHRRRKSRAKSRLKALHNFASHLK